MKVKQSNRETRIPWAIRKKKRQHFMQAKMLKYYCFLWTFLALLPGAAPGQAASAVQVFPLVDTIGLVLRNVRAEAVEYRGRKAVRLTMEGNNEGLALLPGTDFQDGTIEADLALKVTTPPEVRNPGFYGIAFRVRSDASHYEMFYLRPGNANADDQAMRNHSVQYTAAPDAPWYKLRREWPWVYESHADIKLDTWTKIRIEVAGRSAKLYINGSLMPSLVVDGLKGEDLSGAVALWGCSGEESYFSNVKITRAMEQTVTNGSEPTGSWDVNFKSDAGPFDGSMRLTRDGSKLAGSWSGALGQNRALTGTWREGYVELSFTGEWPLKRAGAAGPVNILLAGWIDGKSAKGRMRVDARCDGVWMATQKE